MTATNGVAVLEKVRAALDEAEAAGLPKPGRPALVKATGATEHQVRKALETLEDLAGPYPASSPSALTSDSEPSPATASDEHEPTPTAPHMIEQDSPGEPAQPAPVTQMPPAPPATGPAGGRLVAWCGFVFGSLMSIAANILHTWLPADDMPEGWSPGIPPQIGAAVWPVGLLISVEVLSRVRWRPGFLWSLARYGGAGTVAVGSGIISYGHLRELLLAWGYGHPGAEVGPLVLDGLMVVSGFALLAMSDRQAGERQ